MKRYIVYKHTNIHNGKSYIGITSTKPEKRWNYGHGYDLQPKFSHAIKKYGWNSFTHEILAKGLDKKTACVLEKALIAEYDTVNNGYNTSAGGMDMDKAVDKLAVDKYDPITGKFICSYKSIMDAAFDVKCSDSHISEACRGIHHVVAGYGWAYHGEPYVPPKTYFHFWNYIEKVDAKTGEVLAIYRTQKEAAKANGISSSMIGGCCNGKYATGGGFIWRYSE